MEFSTYKQLENYYQQGYKFLPIVAKKQVSNINIIKILELINKETKFSFILESARIGRFSYLGGEPLYIIEGKNNLTKIKGRDGKEKVVEGNPLETLKELMKIFSTPNIEQLPKFYGGAVGYLSYDMARYFERMPNIAKDDLELPDLYFMIIDKLWVYDNEEEVLYYMEYIEANENLKELFTEKIRNIEKILSKIIKESTLQKNNTYISKEKINRTFIENSFTKEGFIDAVHKIKEYISQGDIFQVNLSVRQSRELKTEGLDIYKHLREINPSPYMGYFNFGNDLQLVSGSPELLVEIKDGMIQTRPIAGTRPRGVTEQVDNLLVQELLNNEKENAEHIMLVDLERNDLGRVCKFGTVKVNELMVIEKYSHVMHIVSNVIGEIAPNKDLYDCIKATFPGGTITGAPKIRTMEIIEELEPVRRGPYTGSMGWIGFNRNMELNILIRTLVIKDGKGHIQAGAGIVIDSIPENEYIESLNKAEAIWLAVESSERAKGIIHDTIYR